MSLSSARRIDTLAAFLPTDEKKRSNLFAVVVKSFEKVSLSWFLDGMTRLMIFQRELGLCLCSCTSSEVFFLSALLSLLLTESRDS